MSSRKRGEGGRGIAIAVRLCFVCRLCFHEMGRKEGGGFVIMERMEGGGVQLLFDEAVFAAHSRALTTLQAGAPAQ